MKNHYPKVIINTRRIAENVRLAVDKCAAVGIDIMGITKVSSGLWEPNEAYIRGGVSYLGFSRLEQLQDARDQSISVPLVLIRIPMQTEVAEMVRICDMSLQSELSVLRLTSEEALRQGKLHKVVLMADLGDLREGFWDKNELVEVAAETEHDMPGLKLHGIGTNLGCYGAIAPTLDKMEELVGLAERISQRIGRKLDMVSVGGSPALMRVWLHDMPEGITNIRVGGIPFMPRRNAEAFGEFFGFGMERKTVRIQAETVSVRDKIVSLAIGEADYGSWHELLPLDESIRVIGATDDLTFVDIGESSRTHKVGDIIEFDGTYTTLVYLSKSKSVNIEYKM